MKLDAWFFVSFLNISINLNCSNAPNTRPANSPSANQVTTHAAVEIPFDENKYDMVKYFRDVEWTTLTGIKEVSKNELSYPYVAFAYKKQFIDMYVLFDQKRIVKWICNKHQSTRYIKLRHYDRQYGDSVYMYWLYNDKSDKLVQLNCFSGNLFKEKRSNPGMILQALPLDSLSIRRIFYFGNRSESSVFLRDVLAFDTLSFKGKFDIKESSLLRVKNGALYQTTLSREDYVWNKNSVASEEAISVPKFEYSSFFYFYVSLYEDWDSVYDDKSN